ncbi:MAG: multiheme c-type cytochrome [Chromatiaceae bacterium]
MLICLALLFSCATVFAAASTESAASFVGKAACASCHAEEVERWTGSHHDLAMQEVSEEIVLGDFANASLTHFGVTSTFYRDADRFMVRTEDADGGLADFEIRYVFGVHPLQQYLIEFPGGRLQALGLAWDTRTKEQGGQRWYHLYPNEHITHDDELHWTRPSQNWNSMCAECHSTHLQKNYDPKTRSFATSWSEIDVSCEACHGPGSEHVDWAEQKPGWEQYQADKGLALLLDERDGVSWLMDPETGNARRSVPRRTDKEIEMCARCHARRSPISEQYRHGDRFMDHYLPRRLDEGLYFADGQMDDEVFVYGSFIQSKMYHAGVTCSDCHEPHSADLKVPGNAICLQCHQATKYDAPSHHFHQDEASGGSCASCHMPPRNYMVVDARHDHSMRIPRPDLSVAFGTPNACNNCHQDKSPKWAADQVVAWYGGAPQGLQRYTAALQAVRERKPSAGPALASLIRDVETPDIARATALAAMAPHLTRQNVDVLAAGVADDNPLVRAATLSALDGVPINLRARLAWPLLEDPVRGVRIEAARVLAAVPAGQLEDAQRAQLDRAMAEYVDSQLAMAERPTSQVNLGIHYADRGAIDAAIEAYEVAIELDPGYVPAYANLAYLHQGQGDETAAEAVLRRGIDAAGRSAGLQHALGLALVRQQRTAEGVDALRRATRLDPGNARYVYVYAVALNSTGQPRQAIMVLQGAHNAHPNDTDILSALVAFHRDAGNPQQSKRYAEKLNRITRESASRGGSSG